MTITGSTNITLKSYDEILYHPVCVTKASFYPHKVFLKVLTMRQFRLVLRTLR